MAVAVFDLVPHGRSGSCRLLDGFPQRLEVAVWRRTAMLGVVVAEHDVRGHHRRISRWFGPLMMLRALAERPDHPSRIRRRGPPRPGSKR